MIELERAVSWLIIVILFCAVVFFEYAYAQTGSCQKASIYCWCKDRASIEDVRDNPGRYRREIEKYGNKNNPTVCMEFIDTEQSTPEGGKCTALRKCIKADS